MKRLFALLLAVMLVASMATVVSAANTTTLTTTVPAATYTLNIPADQKIEFAETVSSLGNVTVTNSSGFAEGKNLEVTVTYDAFASNDVTTTIPFSLFTRAGSGLDALSSGSSLVFEGLSSGAVAETVKIAHSSGFNEMNDLQLKVESTDWGKALAGDYTATITFTAEVVVE